MTRHDPLTNDLFNSTAVSGSPGLGLAPSPFATPLAAGSHATALPATPLPPARSPAPAARSSAPSAGQDYRLAGDRPLARGWPSRARDNIEAISLALRLEHEVRPATPAEQDTLVKFIGFGATDLANGAFRRPGEAEFRTSWRDIGSRLEELVTADDYASLARCTQYAHFTPEPLIRAIWAGLQRMGFNGGRVLEPGVGTALFPALAPAALSEAMRFTGVEIDPVTARIARLLQPGANIVNADFARTTLPAHFDLAVGNPPFSDRIVRGDPLFRKFGLRLHDYFIAKSISLLKPGGLAAFVTSTGTMDKADTSARHEIARSANLVGAIRLPEGSFRATAGSDVVVDILFFRKRHAGEDANHDDWVPTQAIFASPDDTEIWVNRWFAANPEMVLGRHAIANWQFGEDYTCLPGPGAAPLVELLRAAVARLPAGIYDNPCPALDADPDSAPAASNAREGSYFIGRSGALMQVLDGREVTVEIRSAKSADGIHAKHARIIRKLIPVRDAVRGVLVAQEQDLPFKDAQVKLRVAWSAFVREFGPINSTSVSFVEDPRTGESRELHRRLNLSPFQDDPDCWLVASIEDYDLESNTARPGPLFCERVIAPPPPPVITSAADALAVVLNDLGCVDIDAIAELIHVDRTAVIHELGVAIYRDPVSGQWQTADAYLSGPVRTKLGLARLAAETDPEFARNVAALEAVQPIDLRPSDISARLGAPWIPAGDVVAFVRETMGAHIRVVHNIHLACWTVDASGLGYTPVGTSEWGTHRRHAGQLLSDALNSQLPQIFDTERGVDGSEKRVLNTAETEAAKDRLQKIKTAFAEWVWSDPDRADTLSRLYNDNYNNLAPRKFDGSHLKLPGASQAFSLYDHQKRVIWRIIASGSTYIAHAVGAGKTLSIAAAIMEQRRLGLINCAMLVVPGHCLAQAAREFLALYPNARILVADETNFAKDKRRRFLARAATRNWDAVIITHSAFKFIPVPDHFERAMIEEELASYDSMITNLDRDDRLSRKRIERMKEGLRDRLQSLAVRKDDLLTLPQIGIDQIIVDEAQEFRKLTFSTNMSTLRGVDPNGSQRAWDLYVKTRFLEKEDTGRALILASGTPITNTLGEMFTLQRFQGREALIARGLHEFDAWAANFGDTVTELELQPSGKYKPVTRFAEFVNVPELIAMFRTFADVVMPQDLRQYVKIPALSGGKRQIITAEASPAFRAYQRTLEARVKAIEERKRPPQPGDDILLSVITDGRHAAIDMRLVDPEAENEPGNKLNDLIRNAHRIWRETAVNTYLRKDGKPYDAPGAGQLIFSDLGTLAVEAKRGFSAYRWIRDELVRRGVPPSEIAFMQDYKKSEAKQRLFNDFNAGKVRFLLGSSETMGTGVNVQLRLKALHHLDVPWLPSQIEQRDGRIGRQGNQHDEIDICAYATLGSMDATMWQNNERKARFIAAALSGDTSVRRLEDLEAGQASQFAMAKAIASGDPRLMQKAGLEAEIARLDRLKAAHFDDQLAVRRTLREAQSSLDSATRRASEIEADLARRVDTSGDRFVMEVCSGKASKRYSERAEAGTALVREVNRLVDLRFNGETVLGTIGGFGIAFSGMLQRLDDYTFETAIIGTGADYGVDFPLVVSARGAVSRLEHALAGLEDQLATVIYRKNDAATRLANYVGRAEQPFGFDAELRLKRAQLAEIDADLARSECTETGEAVAA